MRIRTSALLIAALIGLSGAVPQSAKARGPIIYVGPGGGSGGCLEPLYVTDGTADEVQINQALDNAHNGDTVELCAARFELANDVYYHVDVLGDAISVIGQGSDLTIIDGNSLWNLFTLDTHAADVTVDGISFVDGFAGWGSALLAFSVDAYESSFTITNCVFTGNRNDNDGGAVVVEYGSVDVSGSTFTDNTAQSDGGAIQADIVTVHDSVFSGNAAQYSGGAISADTSLAVYDSTFTENIALKSWGGAIRVRSADLTIERSTFTGNQGAREGGAVAAGPGSAVTITDSVFTANRSSSGNGNYGGALAQSGGSLAIYGSTFTGNTADYGGAMDVWNGATMLLWNTVFTRNIASQWGGAIATDAVVTSTEIRGNRFSGNRAKRGRSLYLYGDKALMRTSSKVWIKNRIPAADIYIHP
jgi:hypothetical protein